MTRHFGVWRPKCKIKKTTLFVVCHPQ